MKKRFLLLGLAVAGLTAVVLTSCAGSPSGTTTSRVQLNIVITDYQGAAIGSAIPDWVEAAINGDLETLKMIPRFQGKIPLVDWGNGQNLDLLRSWVSNFNVQAGVSRRIRNYMEAEFGGKQLGSKDTPENRNFLSELVTSFSHAQYSGVAKEMDYWVKIRFIDNGREEYRYYVVYSIAEQDLQHQIDLAMGRISAATREQQEIKNDVETGIRQARFNSIQQAN